MVKQSLQQSLQQKLSPQQIQLMKLIELSTLELEQKVKDEIETNPALDEDTISQDDSGDDFEKQDAVEKTDDLDSYDDFDINDFFLTLNFKFPQIHPNAPFLPT